MREGRQAEFHSVWPQEDQNEEARHQEEGKAEEEDKDTWLQASAEQERERQRRQREFVEDLHLAEDFSQLDYRKGNKSVAVLMKVLTHNPLIHRY